MNLLLFVLQKILFTELCDKYLNYKHLLRNLQDFIFM